MTHETEPHDGDEQFRSSTPDLTPNLSDDMMTANHAERIYKKHKAEGRELETMKDIEDQAGDADFALNKLLASDIRGYGLTEDNLKTLQEARGILGSLRAKVTSSPGREGGDYFDARRNADATLWKSHEHLTQHREQYENEAVNDYNKAQAENPESYPEPLKYGDTQPPQDSPEE